MLLRRTILTLFLCFLLVVGLPGLLQAKEIPVHTFQDEVDYLALLQLWPDRDWNPDRVVDYREYITLLEKLCNGRGDQPLYQVADQINAAGIATTYREALTIAGIFMGYTKEEAFGKVKSITGELKRADATLVTGYDMAYIFYNLLQNPRVGQSQTLIAERYLVGANPRIVSRLIQMTANQVILEDDGALPLAQDARVFWVREGRVSPLSMSRVAVGMSGLKFFFNQKNEVQTIVMTDHYYPETIRVLLSVELTSLGSSKSYDFSEIQVTATQPFKVCVRKNGSEETVYVAETGEVVTFKRAGDLIALSSGNGSYSASYPNRVYLKSYLWHNISFDPLINTQRNGKIPVYAGTLEIFPGEQTGVMHLVNELPLEMYLRKVVAAQIPAGWGTGAAKVQAIAARSYAMSQVTRGKFSDKAAHVDDSNTTQIYNNSPESTVINEAIDDTEGLVLTYVGNIIDAVFFSVSCGVTANSEEVWHNDRTREFPGVAVNYLRSSSLLTKDTLPDLSKEANVIAFLKSNTVKAYDSAAPFFRWKIMLNRKELELSINQGLLEREKADRMLGTDFVQTLQGTPVDPAKADFNIGTLKDLRVVERGEGGNIMVLDIVGTIGTYRVMKEYNIRFVIRPRKESTGSTEDVLTILNDGSTLKNYGLLPSAFAAFEVTRNAQGDLDKVTIYGGGNGHGVGLSQWAVKGMADAGFTVEQILQYFYRGVKIEQVY